MTNNTTIPSEQMNNTVSDERKALLEIVEAHEAPFPSAFAGMHAQDAWATRRSNAIRQARALLALKAEQPAALGEPVRHKLSDEKLPQLPMVGPITYAMAADVMEYKVPRVGPHLPGVFDVALWSTDQMRAYARDAVRKACVPIEPATAHGHQVVLQKCTEVLQSMLEAPTTKISVLWKESIRNLLSNIVLVDEHHPSPAAQVPEGWTHDCAALLVGNLELWVAACPHCGKPRPASPKPPAQAVEQAVHWTEALAKDMIASGDVPDGMQAEKGGAL